MIAGVCRGRVLLQTDSTGGGLSRGVDIMRKWTILGVVVACGTLMLSSSAFAGHCCRYQRHCHQRRACCYTQRVNSCCTTQAASCCPGTSCPATTAPAGAPAMDQTAPPPPPAETTRSYSYEPAAVTTAPTYSTAPVAQTVAPSYLSGSFKALGNYGR